MMSEWSTKKKNDFRGEMLTVLAGRHLAQKSRLYDLQVCSAMQSNGWDCEMRDIVTILQDMEGRGWVAFRSSRNEITRRVQLDQIAILPAGQDLVDGVTTHPAVDFL